MLDDRPDGGARVSMIFDNSEDRQETAATATDRKLEKQDGG